MEASHDLFVAARFTDPRVQAAILHAASSPGEIGVGQLFAGAVRQCDQQKVESVRRAIQPGCSVEDLLAALAAPPAGSSSSSDVGQRFSREASASLTEFENAAGRLAFPEAALELLLTCLLRNFGESERKAAPFFDHRLASRLLGDRIEQVLQASSDRYASAKAGWQQMTDQPTILLPPEAAPSEDLTGRIRAATVAATFPFDGEPKYEQLFDAIARVLHRRQHIFLTGERGVGKSTIITELARRATAGRIPFLQPKRFVSVDCRYVPADESRARLVAILGHLSRQPHQIVCLEGAASLLRSGRTVNNKAILMSVLSQSTCQVIGLVSPREYEELATDDPDFSEFFTRIEVEEPDADVALKLLHHFALGLEQKYAVRIDDEAVRQAVVLTSNYILNDHLPAKALKILHRVCEDIDYERTQLGMVRDQVSVGDVIRLVAEVSGVPEETLRGIADKSDYDQSLREVIFGQNHAVHAVATELGLIKAGMTDPHKPASVMLFLGQTGTGKTELAKALARFYSTSKRLKTYTLGNCVEPHSVSTIIGVPPGYVGHDQGGRLVNELNADPYCVFLLDEADKSHPDVLQPFLNLFDEGWVCDQRGIKAYANKSIFILTTNVGQRMIAEMFEQKKDMEEIANRMKEALSQIRHSKSDRPVFTAEFLARIKRIIVFRPLDREAMLAIAHRQVRDLQESWSAKRGKKLHVPRELIDYVGEQAHQINDRSKGKEGGRIVRKLIAEWIESKTQQEISQRPAEYKSCKSVNVECLIPNSEVAAVPTISVSFSPNG